MTALALLLVLSSAALHATWNLFAKRASGGAGFIWLITVMNTVIWLPLALAVVVREHPVIGPREVVWAIVSGALQVLYFILLNRGYRAGDLSVVYPLARGTGPMLSTTLAIVLLGERPTLVAFIGALCIGLGVMILTGDPRKFRQNGASKGVQYALLTGLIIATYTLWDRQGVAALLVPPLLYDYLSNLSRMALLTPYALRHRAEVARHWTEHRWPALGVAVLSPLAYILVLTALTFSPVSYVAPAREISILIGAALGTRLLSEGDSLRRLAAASVMVIGVIALALG